MRVSSVIQQHTSQSEILSALFLRHRRQEHAFALWRQPASLERHFLVCTSGTQAMDELPLEELQTGFAFAPFEKSGKKLFLKADTVYSFSADSSLSGEFSTPEFQKFVDEARSLESKELIHLPQEEITVEDSKEAFIHLVHKAVSYIKSGLAEKIVPSRAKKLPLKNGIDVIGIFDQLCIQYPNAMVSLVSIPGIGTWMGATPELLESIGEKKCFRTTAVAGTQVYDPSRDLRNVMWTQKEIEEQAFVTRYIINCFKKIRLRDYKEQGPKTFIAGNLIHLKTDFEADMLETGFPNLGSQMLTLLHPTSAICGTPMIASSEFLLEHEGYDRQFYSGYLGPINFKGETQLFVNIRCMQLTAHNIILYAGAGVTIDSVAEKEWQETEMKMDTLLRVITL